MLEKIGLPSKPSVRGGNWVVDASHCQGCPQQFTFINRKHHCRRCGGLFCNSCTQQRMVLRGQGDSAVRICDPCKKIEEAARFELRYGKRNRGTKSNTKPVAMNEDELLKELLDDDKLASKSLGKSRHGKISDLQREASSSKGSSFQHPSISSESVENIIRSVSSGAQNNVLNKVSSSSTEKPHSLVMEEICRSNLLKAEGKSGEIKHGKELEKQDGALGITSSSSSLNIQDHSGSSESVDNNTSIPSAAELCPNEVCPSSPEEMRRLAVEEKSKYKQLKAERKPEEALAAFKRGKALEKQAAALEIAIRKSRRLASVQKTTEDQDGIINKRKVSVNINKDGKDDLTTELRELGWSDADLHDADKKQEPQSLEGELFSMLREIPQKSHSGPASNVIDRSGVVALKKKALMLKREGKLAEAKEELKQAKILEKQLEEEELLAGAEDSDDELSALIHSIDAEKKENLMSELSEPSINFDDITNVGDDFAFGGNFDVTDDDMNDPELFDALKSFGWTEEDESPTENVLQSSVEKVSEEILSLKKEAVYQKRAGNTAGALELLRKAKLLEKDLGVSDGIVQNVDVSPAFISSKSQSSDTAAAPMTHSEEKMVDLSESRRPNKSKFAIQKELLALKRKALALRREGRVEEADEELRKGKILEQELEEMEKPQKYVASKVSQLHDSSKKSTALDLVEADDEEVTEQDMRDPTLLSDLETLGWKDDMESSKKSKLIVDPSVDETATLKVPTKPTKSKGQLQRELLGIKRKALAFRRQGKTEEAEEELKRAKGLEDQLAELDSQHQLDRLATNDADSVGSSFAGKNPEIPIMALDKLKADKRSKNADLSSLNESSSDIISSLSKNSDGPTQAPILVTDTEAENLIPGSTTEDSIDLRVNKCIGTEVSEGSLGNLPSSVKLPTTETLVEQPLSEPKINETVSIKPLSSQSFKMEDLLAGDKNDIPFPVEKHDQITNTNPIISDSNLQLDTQPICAQTGISCTENPSNLDSDTFINVAAGVRSVGEELNAAKGHRSTNNQVLELKKKAVALKKQGKVAEALEELRQAKLLEKSLGESSHEENVAMRTEPVNIVENSSPQNSKKVTSPPQKPMSSRDRFKLQQESLSHKRQALRLRREGKNEEAEALIELAKKLEAQIEEADGTSTDIAVNKEDESLVEDLLDPELMSALKSVGWNEREITSHASTSKSAETKNVNTTSRKDNLAPQVRTNVKAPLALSDSQARKNNSDINTSMEKSRLEEQIKGEKLRALHLKRSGRQSDALEALRTAKRLEKRLESLPS